MYKYYNANPKGKLTNDCVKRAISKASGIPYNDVKNMLNRYKVVSGADKFNDPKNYEGFLDTYFRGIKKQTFQAVAGEKRMTGERFCREFPTGRYILRMAGHLTCCINGVIYDTWDCSNKCVYKSWQLAYYTSWQT